MFFSKKNLRAHDVTRMPKPWTFKSKAPYDTMDKAEFAEWSLKASTDHAFINAVEGVNPHMAVTKENPARVVHGFIADYDGIVPDNPVDTILKKFKGGYLPTWFVRSRGENGHVVWEYADPVTTCDNEHAKKLMEYVGKQVKASKMFGDYDRASYEPTTYFEIGREWIPIPGGKPLSGELLRLWDSEIFKAMFTKGTRHGDVLPIEVLAAEAEKRWPGRCKRFEVGAHCLRFWDPISDNETGCQICPDGVRVYVTGPNGGKDAPFKTWAQIFGNEFVDEYRSGKFDESLGECYVDSRGQFWLKDQHGVFRPITDHAFMRLLKCKGFSTVVPKGKTSSPAEDMATLLSMTKRVDSVVNLLYYPEGLVYGDNGERQLNIATTKPVDPGLPLFPGDNPAWNTKETHDAFPFIHDVVTSLFQDPDACYTQPLDEQLEYFLSWLAVFYQRSLRHDPSPGQALFLCGQSNVGKTFLSRVLLSKMMGGYADASDYFLGTSPWNSTLVNRGIMSIDDSNSTIDYNTSKRFHGKIKAFVANGTIIIHAKYIAVSEVPIRNRLVVTLNEDLLSRSILPGLDGTIRDKVSYLLLSSGKYRRPLNHHTCTIENNNRKVEEQMPAFCRWIYEMEIPERWLGETRYGVIAYQHPKLDVSATMQNGFGLEIMEGLDFALKGEPEGFYGHATQLLTLLGTENKFLGRNLDVKRLARTLTSLARDGYDIKLEEKDGTVYYRIPQDVMQKGRVNKPWDKTI
jgi:hypothetical protein